MPTDDIKLERYKKYYVERLHVIFKAAIDEKFKQDLASNVNLKGLTRKSVFEKKEIEIREKYLEASKELDEATKRLKQNIQGYENLMAVMLSCVSWCRALFEQLRHGNFISSIVLNTEIIGLGKNIQEMIDERRSKSDQESEEKKLSKAFKLENYIPKSNVTIEYYGAEFKIDFGPDFKGDLKIANDLMNKLLEHYLGVEGYEKDASGVYQNKTDGAQLTEEIFANMREDLYRNIESVSDQNISSMLP